MIIWCIFLLLFGGKSSWAIRIIGEPFDTTTMDISFFSELGCQGQEYRFLVDPEKVKFDGVDPTEIQVNHNEQSNQGEFVLTGTSPTGFMIKSMRIDRAEAGFVIDLFRGRQSTPAIEVGFPSIDIHQSFCIQDLSITASYPNIHVQSDHCQDSHCHHFQRIVIKKSSPTFFVL